MTRSVELPLWLLIVIVAFAAITFASHFLFPSVRWFFRRRLERAVARLNARLTRPIEPFKLARRHDMIQRLIYDPQVGRAVQAHARADGVPEAVAFEQARRYAREIVPSFSAFTYFTLAIRAARLLSNALYDVRLINRDDALLKTIDRDATVVFVMNHRSNMDYVLVTYLSAQQSALSYAVGEWARVWPLSRLIRAMGAYFIRRKSRSDLYRQVLACYVRQATEAGVTQAIFPEGGLSLTGALGEPRLGLLKYMLDGSAGHARDVIFVPVALNYDRVLEDTILTGTTRRGGRRLRARIGLILRWLVRQVWQRLRGRSQRLGTAAVEFGRPLSLQRFHRERPGAGLEPLAEELMARIGQIVPVLPVPLAAYLVSRRAAVSQAEIGAGFAAAARALPAGQVHLPDGDPHRAAELGLKQLLARRMVVEQGGSIRPNPDRLPLLEYYAASVRHLDLKISAEAKSISAAAGS